MYLLKPSDMQFQDNIESLYSQISHIDNPNGKLTLDLSETSWVFPHSILGIITAARLWHRHTKYPIALSNMDNSVHRYLERMNLFSQCEMYLYELQKLRRFYDRSTNSERLLEVVSIPSNEQPNIVVLREALRRAKAILSTWISNPNLVGSVLTMLSEIGQNVVHSQDLGYMVIQRYKQPHSHDLEFASEIHLGIGDIGIGIEESLMGQYPHLKHDFSKGSDYIQHALVDGISGLGNNRGLGLHRVSELVNKWNGSLTIRSNGSQIRISDNSIETWDDLCEIPGVQVFIIVRGRATN